MPLVPLGMRAELKSNVSRAAAYSHMDYPCEGLYAPLPESSPPVAEATKPTAALASPSLTTSTFSQAPLA
ncbi:hypothetical protein HYH03_016987 [Edaphochlamys debaryana]|uniref:Uncharacterized protein n=1 Tax=Edaphochlamys debaryana TaxID=47281 RepID=A0A835XQ91_9CHLO|nr:hypothetical protein HYH03_016987 [Edaphochlamys debaryana]|eukprot:KAG2484174.1 hypothetical protein HYH03_016987 [Edaphochlamys debaryana]